MSLVRVINSKDPKSLKIQEALKLIKPEKKDFKTKSSRTPFSKEYNMLVESELTTTGQAALIGTAFDYIARFIISKYTNISEDEFTDMMDNLIALNVLNHLEYRMRNEIYQDIKSTILEYLTELISYKQYKKLLPTSKLLACAIKMARLEAFYRSGMLTDDYIENLLCIEDDILIEELRMLSNVFIDNFINSDNINPNSDVVYNPTFGTWSRHIGGADADIYIDGVLYDFKTTKRNGYVSKEAMQLVGYYLLHELSKGETNVSLYGKDITKIAFYKARFGETEIFDIKNILSNNKVTAKYIFINELV